jgi:hypothetical protein
MNRYGSIFPPLAHDWRNIDQSPIILALAKFDGVSTTDALKTYKRTWTVARDKEKTAFAKDKATGLVRSRNYVAPIVFTEEQKAVLADVKWFDNKTNFENEYARILNIGLARINRLKKALEEAKAQGLWEEGEVEGRYLSPAREKPSYFYAGKNRWEKYRAKKAQDDEAKRLEAERLEAKSLAEKQQKTEERVRRWGIKGQRDKNIAASDLFYNAPKEADLSNFKYVVKLYLEHHEADTSEAEKIVDSFVRSGKLKNRSNRGYQNDLYKLAA